MSTTYCVYVYLYCYVHPCWLFDLPLPKPAVPQTRAVAEWQPVNHTATNDGGLENDVSGGACDRDDTEYNGKIRDCLPVHICSNQASNLVWKVQKCPAGLYLNQVEEGHIEIWARLGAKYHSEAFWAPRRPYKWKSDVVVPSGDTRTVQPVK
jgi:hypothetical protein